MSTRQDIYNAICDYWLDNGYAPSVRDILKQVPLAKSSTATVNYHIGALCEQGVLEQEYGQSRTVRPVDMRISFERLEVHDG